MAGALVGATALSLGGGTAKASGQVPVCTFTSGAGCGTPTVTLDDKILTVIEGPTAGTGDVEFQWQSFGPGPFDDVYSTDIDFNEPGGGDFTNGNGIFKYKLAIDQSMAPNNIFRTVNLQWIEQGSGVTVSKEVYSDSAFTNLIKTLNTDNQTESIASLGLNEIWIKDIYNAPATGSIDNISNNYTQVPGPLPLLGAGTAFGFSRRLRRRLKQRLSLV